jgi:hypothetical protein
MLFRETVAVHSYNIEHISTVCGQKAEFLNVEAGGTYNNCALEFIFSCLLSIMQQYQDLKFNPFKTVTALHV